MSSSAKKIAICVDSSIAIEKNTYKDLYIIPLTINETVNGQTFSYRDGIDITCDKVAKKLLSGSFIKTASSIPGDITALFEKICDKYDEIYCFTAPKSISGTYKSWEIAIKLSDYKNITLFEQTMVCAPLEWTIRDLIAARDKNILDVAFVNKYLKNVYGKKQIDILVPDLKYLVHGGRISKFKGSMAKFFRLMTTVTLTDTKLDKFGVDNTFAKAIETVSLTCFDELRKGHAIKRIGIFTNEVCSSKYKYKVFCDAVTAKLQLLVSKNVQIEYFKLPAFIIAHTGPNYVGVAMEVV